ncbi:MAG: hypothetical protein HN383_13615 [Verrucomicrobia bacterium]|nr:hypothetical protein [Verrucomicrobiota bacterium]
MFRDEQDHLHFLKRLAARVDTYGVRLFAHCEMLTHYHLLIETPLANLGRFMHSLNTAYTLCYNLRHRRKGPLVQGRYGAKLVEGDNYLLSLSRYIHLNPVHIKAMEKQSSDDQRRHLNSYRWSSYRAYIGREKAPEWLEPLPILSQCGSKRSNQRKAYRAFVEGSIEERDEALLDALSGTWPGIGDESFLGWVKEQYIEQAKAYRKTEDVRLRKERMGVEPETVLRAVAEVLGVEVEAFRQRRRNSMLRAMGSQMLSKYAGLTQREIAGQLGIRSGAAVGQQQQKLREALPHDRGLRKQLSKIEQALDSEQG